MIMSDGYFIELRQSRLGGLLKGRLFSTFSTVQSAVNKVKRDLPDGTYVATVFWHGEFNRYIITKSGKDDIRIDGVLTDSVADYRQLVLDEARSC